MPQHFDSMDIVQGGGGGGGLLFPTKVNVLNTCNINLQPDLVLNCVSLYTVLQMSDKNERVQIW